MYRYKDLRPEVPLEYAQCTELYADGVATIEALGPNIRATYFTWYAEAGNIEVKRMPVIRIVRPAASFVLHKSGLLSAFPSDRH